MTIRIRERDIYYIISTGIVVTRLEGLINSILKNGELTVVVTTREINNNNSTTIRTCECYTLTSTDIFEYSYGLKTFSKNKILNSNAYIVDE